MTTCLITGGAGFIGSHLTEACLGKGWKVIVLDDLSAGKRENLPLDAPGLEFIRGDVRDRDLLGRIREGHPSIDYVFHLAAIVSVPRSMEHPLETHEVNFLGTLFLLDAFRDAGVRKLALASSAAVYGDRVTLPIREDFLPNPLSPYGADKLMGEYYLKIYNDAFDLPTVACRFFNVFGERQDPSSPYSGVISIFLDRAVKGKGAGRAEVTIYGDGRQTRDFIYVKDLVGALLHLAQEPNIRGEVYNLGYGKQKTVLDLARDIEEFVGVPMDIAFKDPRPGDVRDSLADIRRLRSTGFSFSYDFSQGLQRLTGHLLQKNPSE